MPDVVLFCELQFSSNGVGFCIGDLRLENTTLVAKEKEFASRASTYQVNGQDVHGWFSLDFTSDELRRMSCKHRLTVVYIENSNRKFLSTLSVLHDEVS